MGNAFVRLVQRVQAQVSLQEHATHCEAQTGRGIDVLSVVQRCAVGK
jgi:hypothetical protein